MPRGFATPSRKVELYSRDLPRARLPAAARLRGAADRPGVAAGPRGALPADPDLRQADAVLREPAPRAAEPAQARAATRRWSCIPTAAQARGIADGDWVAIETPEGSVRARARLNDEPRSARGVRPARLVAGLRRDRRAGLRPVRRRTAPTSTCSSAARRSTRSAARRRTAPICARSGRSPEHAAHTGLSNPAQLGDPVGRLEAVPGEDDDRRLIGPDRAVAQQPRQHRAGRLPRSKSTSSEESGLNHFLERDEEMRVSPI